MYLGGHKWNLLQWVEKKKIMLQNDQYRLLLLERKNEKCTSRIESKSQWRTYCKLNLNLNEIILRLSITEVIIIINKRLHVIAGTPISGTLVFLWIVVYFTSLHITLRLTWPSPINKCLISGLSKNTFTTSGLASEFSRNLQILLLIIISFISFKFEACLKQVFLFFIFQVILELCHVLQ